MASEATVGFADSDEETKDEQERTELIELWEIMKKHNEMESGETKDSLHAKYLRFTMEKEFVELLSNPRYLHSLAQKNLMEDERFIRYLKYLEYWRTPSYAKCIKHVHCLKFLELLQNETFRKRLKEPSFIEMIHTNQYYHWFWAKTNEFQHKYQVEHDEKETLAEDQPILNSQNNQIDDNDIQMNE
eukprot:279056_1